jgi:Ni/Co efflux regulator RcnB
MMKYPLLFLSFLLLGSYAYADENNNSAPQKSQSKQTVHKKDSNNSQQNENNSTGDKKQKMAEKIKKQIELEKKYAKEQKFYQGDAYDLKAHEVDPNSLPEVPVIEPDYDFDITDVYRDDI